MNVAVSTSSTGTLGNLHESSPTSPHKAGGVWKGRRGQEASPPEQARGLLSLCLVLSGSASYQVGGQRYHVSPASLCWIFPLQQCDATHPSPDHEVWVAAFERELVEKVCVTHASKTLATLDPSDAYCRQLTQVATRRLLLQMEDLAAPGRDAEQFNAGLSYLL